MCSNDDDEFESTVSFVNRHDGRRNLRVTQAAHGRKTADQEKKKKGVDIRLQPAKVSATEGPRWG